MAEFDEKLESKIEETIDHKLKKLGGRIKNTSTVRFAASKRIRFNYALANLTVVVLSLWSILISYAITANLISSFNLNRSAVETSGLILPVFIVVFSLIEGGENLVRAHLMELNARQLRELSDKYFSHLASHFADDADHEKIKIFEQYSKEYNDILERSPINHDDIDHWGRYFARKRKDTKEFSFRWYYYLVIVVGVWIRRQTNRILYFILWLSPLLLLLVPAQ